MVVPGLEGLEPPADTCLACANIGPITIADGVDNYEQDRCKLCGPPGISDPQGERR